MEPVITVRGASKVFGSGRLAFTALHPIDIDVRRGEVLLLVGPSGSGKTTLLSLMGCVLSPTTGEIVVDGLRVTGLKERELAVLRRDHVGFVFQQFNLLAGLGAAENVELPLMLRGVPARERRRRAERALFDVGLGDKLRAKPSELSGGQQQRVAIARALAADPKVLLCDEPTAALDAQSGREVMAILVRLAREEGRAVVVVTHDSRVFAYATRIIHLEDGRVVEGPAAAE